MARDLDTALFGHSQRGAHPARAYSIGAPRRVDGRFSTSAFVVPFVASFVDSLPR